MYGSYALACFLFGTRTFFVSYLSSLHLLMSGGPDLQPDYYLTTDGSNGGVPDTNSMFSRQLLTSSAWKLMNNRCETVVHRTKVMTYIFRGIIKHVFPVSLSPVQKRSSCVQRTFCQLLMCCALVLPGTCPLLVQWCPLTVLYMSGNHAFIVCFMNSIHRSWEPRAAAGTTFITEYLSAAIFLSVSICVTSIYAIRQGVTDALRWQNTHQSWSLYLPIQMDIILEEIYFASKAAFDLFFVCIVTLFLSFNPGFCTRLSVWLCPLRARCPSWAK